MKKAVKLEIPYKPQLGLGADGHRNDCGPACISMCAQPSVKVDDVSDATGKVNSKGATFQQMYRGLQWSRVSFKYQRPLRLEHIRGHINNRNPSILILNYGRIPANLKNDKKFTGAHFVLAVGYDDDGVFVHDPLWYGDGGAYIHWPDNVVDFAMAEPGWGNQPYQGIVIKKQFEFVAAPSKAPLAPSPSEEEMLSYLHELYRLLGVTYADVPLNVAQELALEEIKGHD